MKMSSVEVTSNARFWWSKGGRSLVEAVKEGCRVAYDLVHGDGTFEALKVGRGTWRAIDRSTMLKVCHTAEARLAANDHDDPENLAAKVRAAIAVLTVFAAMDELVRRQVPGNERALALDDVVVLLAQTLDEETSALAMTILEGFVLAVALDGSCSLEDLIDLAITEQSQLYDGDFNDDCAAALTGLNPWLWDLPTGKHQSIAVAYAAVQGLLGLDIKAPEVVWRRDEPDQAKPSDDPSAMVEGKQPTSRLGRLLTLGKRTAKAV
jgi:hypothetical protein